MPASIDVDELIDEHETRPDFRRANGSPMVTDPSDDSKFIRYRRPSSYGKPLDDEEALTNWRIWKAITGVASSKALQIQVLATKDEDKITKRELREEALNKGQANERADMGTGLHAMCARWEDPTDVDFRPSDDFLPDLEAYRECLDRFGLVSEYVEVPMVNDDFRAAGTADRIYRLTKPLVTPEGEILPAGELILGDLKTGEKLDFGLPAYCVQLAIYATGELYDVVGNKRLPTPEINKRWTLLVHLPFGEAKATVLWCSIDVGLVGAMLTDQVLEWRNAWKRKSDKVYDCPEVRDPLTSTDLVGLPEGASDAALPESTIIEELGATTLEGQELVDHMLVYIGERMAQIKDHDAAKAWTAANWPSDMPVPKHAKEPTHIVSILGFLDEVERRFSLPFLPDPRVATGFRPGERTVEERTSNARGLT
jgi:hypothetical protein